MKQAIAHALESFNGTGGYLLHFQIMMYAFRDPPARALSLSEDQRDDMQLLLLKLETYLIGSSCMYPR